jgi:hypothetical protein
VRWLVLLAAALCATASAARSEHAAARIDLDLYSRLLDSYTRAVEDPAGTRVDYHGLQSSSEWTRLVRQLGDARPSGLGRDARLAFWINAYNILAIDLVVRHHPVESIRDIGSFLFPVWRKRVATIEGRSLSLDAIEHEILRPMREPRIHGAIVCASTSCPALARVPFRTQSLDADLDAAMRAWLASPTKGIAIDRKADVIRLSRIFDWFEEDFEDTGGVLAFIAPFLEESDAAWLRAEGAGASIRYLDYDWSLNDLTRSP